MSPDDVTTFALVVVGMLLAVTLFFAIWAVFVRLMNLLQSPDFVRRIARLMSDAGGAVRAGQLDRLTTRTKRRETPDGKR